MCQRGHSLALCRQGVLITSIQPTKSKSLFELINLIQIRKRRHNFADFFCRIPHLLSATLCSQAEKIRDIMSLMAVFTREWVSPTDLSCFTDSLHNMHRRALLFIDNRQFVGFLHKQTWVASTDMNLLSFIVPCWNIKRSGLQFRWNSNLLLFFYFSVMIQWRIPRKRVARGGKL